MIKLKDFLKMYECGTACISIHQAPFDYEKYRYAKTYFEECTREEIEESEVFNEIKKMKVTGFSVIGGGSYKTELCIYLEKDTGTVSL